MEYIHNDVKFNNVKVNQGIGLSLGPINISGVIGTDPDDGTGIINAVDIDWNGIELESLITNNYVKNNLSNLTINTTSDLIKFICEAINLINQEDEKLLFSVGENEITLYNYETINNVIKVSKYANKYEYIPNERNYVYVLIKNDKIVNIIDAALGGTLFTTEYNDIIPGYKIIKTNGKVSGKIVIRVFDNSLEGVYYFSVGQTPVTLDNYEIINNAIKVEEYESQYEYTTETRDYIYVLIRNDVSVKIVDANFGGEVFISKENINIPNHKLIKTNGKVSGKIYIKIS